MARLTKADVEQINEAVRTGNIQAARRILNDSDDPRAAEMLAKLNTKFPPKAPAMRPLSPAKPAPPVDSLAEAKRLIALKDFDGAEKLLWESDDPAAGDLLRKIELVRSAGGKSVAPTSADAPLKVKPKKSSASPLVGFIAALLLVVVVGAGAFLFMKQQEAAALPGKIHDQLLSVCLDLALNNADVARLSNDAIGHACDAIAWEYMSTYPAIAEQCYLESGGGILEWYGCDARDNAEFNYQHLIDAVNANS